MAEAMNGTWGWVREGWVNKVGVGGTGEVSVSEWVMMCDDVR